MLWPMSALSSTISMGLCGPPVISVYSVPDIKVVHIGIDLILPLVPPKVSKEGAAHE